MAWAYWRRWSRRAVTFMRQRFCSVFTSYSSPTLTLRAALAAMPLNFTLPLSQASAASVRVLKRRMDQRYLSRRIFSFEGIFGRGDGRRAKLLKLLDVFVIEKEVYWIGGCGGRGMACGGSGGGGGGVFRCEDEGRRRRPAALQRAG